MSFICPIICPIYNDPRHLPSSDYRKSVFDFGSNFELGSVLISHVNTFVVGRKHFCQRQFLPILRLLPGLFRLLGLSVPINILFWSVIGRKLISSHLTIIMKTCHNNYLVEPLFGSDLTIPVDAARACYIL